MLPSSTQRARRLAEEISRFEIHGKRVAPSVRTEYRRVAFQRSNDNAVRVSLDVDLTFSDARGTRGDERDGRVINSRNVTFPYAILEIKTRDETPARLGGESADFDSSGRGSQVFQVLTRLYVVPRWRWR